MFSKKKKFEGPPNWLGAPGPPKYEIFLNTRNVAPMFPHTSYAYIQVITDAGYTPQLIIKKSPEFSEGSKFLEDFRRSRVSKTLDFLRSLFLRSLFPARNISRQKYFSAEIFVAEN